MVVTSLPAKAAVLIAQGWRVFSQRQAVIVTRSALTVSSMFTIWKLILRSPYFFLRFPAVLGSACVTCSGSALAALRGLLRLRGGGTTLADDAAAALADPEPVACPSLSSSSSSPARERVAGAEAGLALLGTGAWRHSRYSMHSNQY